MKPSIDYSIAVEQCPLGEYLHVKTNRIYVVTHYSIDANNGFHNGRILINYSVKGEKDTFTRSLDEFVQETTVEGIKTKRFIQLS